ncbi:MAG: hypothetical protein NPINA01_02830 [Nitrospinaceae bacterium]|nr:MAG: hypothetical protein NPINA01_02830 [Nitrospinaceae bacterium]
MFDLPLHPIAVHFPIVLGIALPFVGLLLWWAIRKEYFGQKAWVFVPALALAYSLSAVVAVELGEKDEDKAEKVVSEKVIHEHEEAGEVIPWIAGTLALISLAGFVPRKSHSIRFSVAILCLAAIVPLIDAGHTGGKLVYRYGAANAHLPVEYKALVSSGKFYVQNFKREDEKEHED